MSKSLVVVIPVNRLDRAKGRLATLLTPGERRRLFLATLNTVVEAASGAGAGMVILTPDAEVAAQFGGSATILAEDPALHGLNAQLEATLARLDAPAAGVLILHADLPLVSAEAVRRLADAAPPAPSVTLVRSRDGGTNAMLLRPPGGFALAYGPGSFERHREAARQAGMAVEVVDEPALQLDLDMPADLDALLAAPGGAGSRAGSVLASIDLAQRKAPG